MYVPVIMSHAPKYLLNVVGTKNLLRTRTNFVYNRHEYDAIVAVAEMRSHQFQYATFTTETSGEKRAQVKMEKIKPK